jgi:hypothetical protein
MDNENRRRFGGYSETFVLLLANARAAQGLRPSAPLHNSITLGSSAVGGRAIPAAFHLKQLFHLVFSGKLHPSRPCCGGLRVE